MDILASPRRPHTSFPGALLALVSLFLLPVPSAAALSIPANTWVALKAPTQVLPSGLGGSYQGRGWNHLRYDSVSRRMVLFDGYNEPPVYPLGNIYANSLWSYDPVKNQLSLEKLDHWTHTSTGSGPLPENVADPTPYDRHAYACLVYVASHDAVYLWSGANSNIPDGYIGDMWSYSFAQHAWRPIAGPHPFTVFEQAMAYDPFLEKLVLFGGSDRGYHDGDKTYVFDLKSELWTDVAPVTTPAPRAGQTLTFDSARRVTWMFGGAINGQPTNELWQYDARANTWAQVAASGEGPSPRRFASMAYDSTHDVVLLWGGVTGSNAALTDTWVLHPNSRSWEKLSPATAPDPLVNYAEDMDYDPANDVFVMNQSGKFWLFRYAGEPVSVATTQAHGVQLRLLSSNPARGQARMSFTLSRDADVRIDLVDSLGRRVATLVQGRYPAGEHHVDWAGGTPRRSASGIYYVRLTAEGRVLTRRVVLVR